MKALCPGVRVPKRVPNSATLRSSGDTLRPQIWLNEAKTMGKWATRNEGVRGFESPRRLTVRVCDTWGAHGGSLLPPCPMLGSGVRVPALASAGHVNRGFPYGPDRARFKACPEYVPSSVVDAYQADLVAAGWPAPTTAKSRLACIHSASLTQLKARAHTSWMPPTCPRLCRLSATNFGEDPLAPAQPR